VSTAFAVYRFAYTGRLQRSVSIVWQMVGDSSSQCGIPGM